MPELLNILVIEDCNADFLMVERHLKQNGLAVRCRRVDSLRGLHEAIDCECWDLVMSDFNVPQLNFLESQNLLRASLPDLPIIMVTGTVGEEKAVELLKLGVRDFVLKENLARLVPAVQRALAEKRELKQRLLVEERLRESEAKTRSILDNIGIGVALISPDMEVLELNQRLRDWFPVFDPAQRSSFFRAFNEPSCEAGCDCCPTRKTLQDGLVHEATTQAPQEGGTRNYRIVSSPVLNASGEVTAAIEMVEDITEKLSLEAQYRQSQKMEAVGHLAGGVAHDFNNMLSVILGHAELALLRLSPDNPSYQNLQEIRKAGERSADLTRQLLAFARKQDSVPVIINLNAVITDQLKMLERLIGEDIRIELHSLAELWNTRVDPSQVDQILVNLAVNARDAISGVGSVIIETANITLDDDSVRRYAGVAPGDYICLAFSDTGAGMSEQMLERIFEPFFTTKEEGKGSGLGLSTVYGIVKQNGGLINVYSEPGMGTTFKIYLPRFAGKVTALVELPQAAAMTGTETVLLVEDDEQILDLVRTMLAANGYKVLAVSSPQEACTVCGEHQGNIELLITDVIMPLMNGKELQGMIAGMKPAIRTLFMSGYTADIIAKRGLIDEGVNFLSKPFSIQTLTQKVRQALDG